MFCRILVPLDGSATAEAVLPFARDEARCHNATVVLIRVIAPLRSSLMMVPSLVEQATEKSIQITTEYLDNVASRLRAEGLEVEALPDIFSHVIQFIRDSNKMVDGVYELEGKLPEADETKGAGVDGEVRDFALLCARRAALFTACLWHTAWVNSGEIQLPDWRR